MPEYFLRELLLTHIGSSNQCLYLDDFPHLEFRQSILLEIFECPELPLRLSVDVFNVIIIFFYPHLSIGLFRWSFLVRIVLERDVVVILMSVILVELLLTLSALVVRLIALSIWVVTSRVVHHHY